MLIGFTSVLSSRLSRNLSVSAYPIYPSAVPESYSSAKALLSASAYSGMDASARAFLLADTSMLPVQADGVAWWYRRMRIAVYRVQYEGGNQIRNGGWKAGAVSGGTNGGVTAEKSDASKDIQNNEKYEVRE